MIPRPHDYERENYSFIDYQWLSLVFIFNLLCFLVFLGFHLYSLILAPIQAHQNKASLANFSQLPRNQSVPGQYQ
jgi:hypothetical protein